jgi:hypothetical protein
MNNKKYWKITYLPILNKPSVFQWIFVGEDISDLDAYMQENHACKCEQCVKYKSFLDSPQASEFRIEEINYEDI